MDQSNKKHCKYVHSLTIEKIELQRKNATLIYSFTFPERIIHKISNEKNAYLQLRVFNGHIHTCNAVFNSNQLHVPFSKVSFSTP
jgi:hypothetical protein